MNQTKTRRPARRLLLGAVTLVILLTLALALSIREADSPNLDHIKDPDMRSALAELAEKNKEAADFVSGFRGVTSPPESVDLTNDPRKDGFPILMQWDGRWGYCRYGTGLIGYTGCGPTCLSIVLIGLTGDESFDPASVAGFATDNGHCVPGNGTAWSLFSEGAEDLGLTAKELPLHEGTMKEELDAGRPIIMIMGPGHFTETGHFIVVTGYTEDGFTVIDPNRRSNCEKFWEYEDIKDEVRNLWSYAVKS